MFIACVAAVKSRPVLHHCEVVFFWSSGIMACMFTFKKKSSCHAEWGSVVWRLASGYVIFHYHRWTVSVKPKLLFPPRDAFSRRFLRLILLKLRGTTKAKCQNCQFFMFKNKQSCWNHLSKILFSYVKCTFYLFNNITIIGNYSLRKPQTITIKSYNKKSNRSFLHVQKQTHVLWCVVRRKEKIGLVPGTRPYFFFFRP